MKKRTWLVSLLILLALSLLPFVLLSGTALKFVVHQGAAHFPGLTLREAHGTLVSGLSLEDIRYVSAHEDIHIDRMIIQVNPVCLLGARLCVEHLNIGNTTWTPVAPRPGKPFDFPAVTLPAIKLPIDVTLTEITLSRLHIKASSGITVRDAALKAHTDQHMLYLSTAEAALDLPGVQLSAKMDGSLDLRGDHAVNIDVRTRLDFPEAETLDITANLQGPALTPTVRAKTVGLVDAEGSIRVSFLKKGWPIDGNAMQSERVILDGERLSLRGIKATIGGQVTRYEVTATGRVHGIPHTPKVLATLHTVGGFTGLESITLDASMGEQHARYTGHFAWYPRLDWAGKLAVDRIDLSTWWPEMTTRLSGTLTSTGHWWPGTPLHLDVSPVTLNGDWRGRPTRIDTRLSMRGSRLEIPHIDMHWGDNKIVGDLALGKKWQANAALECPDLAAFVPGLEGRAQAKITVSGPRSTPQLQATLSSPQVTAKTIQLQEVTVSVSGDIHRHRAEIALTHRGYGLRAAVEGGRMHDDFRYQVSRMDLHHQHKMLTLQQPFGVRYSPARQTLAHDALCLSHSGERWCTRSDWDMRKQIADLTLELQHADADWITPLIPDWEGQGGRWTGSGSLTLKDGAPERAAWELRATGTSIKRIIHHTFSPTLATVEADTRGSLEARTLSTELHVLLAENRQVNATFAMPDITRSTDLQWMLDTPALPAKWLPSLPNRLRLREGTLTAQLKGHLKDGWPVVSGRFAADGVRLTGSQNTALVENIGVEMQLAGEALILNGRAQDATGIAWSLTTPARITWTDRKIQLTEGCIGNDTGELCATGHHEPTQGSTLEASLSGNLTHWLAPFLDEGVQMEGPVKGRVSLRQAAGVWTGDGRIEATVTARMTDLPSPDDVTAQLDSQLTLTPETLITRLALTRDKAPLIDGQLQVGTRQPRPINGKVKLHDFPLNTLLPFLPDLAKLEGRLAGEFDVGGELGDPALHGELRVRDGKLSSARLPITLSSLNADMRLSDTHARLEATLGQGRGSGRLTGLADWSKGPLTTQSTLDIDDFPVRRGSQINMRIDANLKAMSDSSGIDLRGRVGLREGFLRIAQVPESATDISRDTVYVGEDVDVEEDTRIPLTVSMAVEVSDMLQLDAFGAQVRLKGGVDIQQLPASDPTGKGTLNITEGTYTGYGQQLRIQKGQIIFNGPLDDPVLAIRAVRQVEAVEVGLNLTGTAQQPETTLFASRGGLTEQEILTYLITGRAPGTGSEGRTALNQALFSVGLYGSEGYARDIASKAGIEDFEISTSSTQTATDKEAQNSLNVGGYLSPRLYVQYGVGINTPVNTLTLRYRLTRNVFLEALSGLENALDILYSFEIEPAT